MLARGPVRPGDQKLPPREAHDAPVVVAVAGEAAAHAPADQRFYSFLLLLLLFVSMIGTSVEYATGVTPCTAAVSLGLFGFDICSWRI